MYILPVYIKRYRSKIKADCFVKYVRLNTMYIYDSNGYVKLSNPRGLICRNEKDKTIILKDSPYYRRHYGGTTAIMIADSEINDEIIITTITYHDWGGTIWFLFALGVGIFGLIYSANPLILGAFISLIVLSNWMNVSALKRQKEFIEKTIAGCEMK